MATLTLELSESQVLELVLRLSPESKMTVLKALVPDLDALERLVDYGSRRIRKLCAKRGIDWDRLTEDERQRLVDDLLHKG
jgi:hypothetical protein